MTAFTNMDTCKTAKDSLIVIAQHRVSISVAFCLLHV